MRIEYCIIVQGIIIFGWGVVTMKKLYGKQEKAHSGL